MNRFGATISENAVRRCAVAAVLALAVASPAIAGTQNLITNGSFESDSAMYSNTQGGQITATNLTGWTTGPCLTNCGSGLNSLFMFLAASGTYNGNAYSYVSNGVDFQGTTINFFGGPGVSPDGGNAITEDAGNETGALEQTLTTLKAGDHYQLTFYQASFQAIPGTSGAFTANWAVSLGGSTQNSPTVYNAFGGYTGWTQVTMNFTASAATEMLAFLASSPSNGQPPFMLLDGVSLIDIPEPGSIAVLALGLGAVVSLRRRRVA